MKKKKLTPLDLLKMSLQVRTKPVKRKEGFKKKKIHELRKEAKKLGMKLSGEYGPDGEYHIYVSKGSFRRQVY